MRLCSPTPVWPAPAARPGAWSRASADRIIDELAASHGDKINFVKMDTNANTQIPTEQGILSLPTLQVWQGGRVVKVLQGAKTKGALLKALEEASGRDLSWWSAAWIVTRHFLCGRSITIFDTATAQDLFVGGEDVYNDIWVTAADGVQRLPHAVVAHPPAGGG